MTIQIRRTATPNNPPIGLDPGQLAVEMASAPPRLWCGVPTTIDPSGRIEVAIGGGGGESVDFSTGDAKLVLSDTAEPGWIIMDDGTIGDSESGATTRANDDCEALFELLWHNIPHSAFEHVVGGRGASAEDDWAAHKQILLPQQRGRALIGAGQGAGLSLRYLGGLVGEEKHAPTVAEMVQHYHPVTDATHNHAGVTDATAMYAGYSTAPAYTTQLMFFSLYSWGSGVSVSASGTGVSFYNSGSSSPFNVVQPSTAWNIMLKL